MRWSVDSWTDCDSDCELQVTWAREVGLRRMAQREKRERERERERERARERERERERDRDRERERERERQRQRQRERERERERRVGFMPGVLTDPHARERERERERERTRERGRGREGGRRPQQSSKRLCSCLAEARTPTGIRVSPRILRWWPWLARRTPFRGNGLCRGGGLPVLDSRPSSRWSVKKLSPPSVCLSLTRQMPDTLWCTASTASNSEFELGCRSSHRCSSRRPRPKRPLADGLSAPTDEGGSVSIKARACCVPDEG